MGSRDGREGEGRTDGREKEYGETSLVCGVIHHHLVLEVNHEHYVEESGVLFVLNVDRDIRTRNRLLLVATNPKRP